ncbi:PREDICTED: uncharacterized protein K02A2.6-like [Priapulus caudatus]|uniref:Uncharacterized protein K02A2.6-like n=1 Tax=Priapulus caudatus TaxID=37621 RepID=A0ABM1EZY5_PRICU|nr:PREDICTED: uncharacterized protein K02A2.6-like [Priapulus caudatus]
MTKLPDRPWSEVSVGFNGTLPQGEYLLVVIDNYSRFPEVEIVNSTATRTVIPVLDKIFSSRGIPDVVKTDNGPPFQSSEFANFAKYMGFHPRKVTPLWPEANGDVESFNKPLNKACTAAQVERQPWKQVMYGFLWNYRNTPHCTTMQTPASIVHRYMGTTKLPQIPAKISDTVLRGIDNRNKEKMKRYADRRRHTKESKLRVGDKVLMKNNVSGKLIPKFKPDPYEVIDIRGPMVIIQRGEEVKARNCSLLKQIHLP